jgi:hypothetical protein
MTELGFRGRGFEDEILETARIYWATRTAYLQRFQVPRVFRNGHAIYTQKTGYDFVGSHFLPGGEARSLYVEAKDIDKNTLPILEPVVAVRGMKTKSQGHGVKFHQLVMLAELAGQGAECWVLWRKGTHVFRLEPQFLLMTVKPGNTLGFLDVPTECVVDCSQGIDFLNALRKH